MTCSPISDPLQSYVFSRLNWAQATKRKPARQGNPKASSAGSPKICWVLESKLRTVIDAVFIVPAISVQRARNILEQLPVEQAAVDSEMARAA
jgi:hypothetical protein